MDNERGAEGHMICLECREVIRNPVGGGDARALASSLRLRLDPSPDRGGNAQGDSGGGVTTSSRTAPPCSASSSEARSPTCARLRAPGVRALAHQ
jgi:hypothetical protein